MAGEEALGALPRLDLPAVVAARHPKIHLSRDVQLPGADRSVPILCSAGGNNRDAAPLSTRNGKTQGGTVVQPLGSLETERAAGERRDVLDDWGGAYLQ